MQMVTYKNGRIIYANTPENGYRKEEGSENDLKMLRNSLYQIMRRNGYKKLFRTKLSRDKKTLEIWRSK